MDRESLERLHFDRRLQNRRGWLAPGELERHVQALPDVSDKLTTLADQEAAGQAPTAESGTEGSQGR
jgi:hypothetical protein